MSITPFYDKIASISQNSTRFFVPGHKGKAAALPRFAQLLQWDITEVHGADDLSNPSAELLESQQNMARAFGSGATLYSAFGSSSVIMAMLAMYVGRNGYSELFPTTEGGDKPLNSGSIDIHRSVVMARGAHVSAIKALALLGAHAHWVLPNAISGVPTAKDIDAALLQSGAKTVYITTVDYYGRMPDVAAIARVCQKHGAALLCDNAHGAYLKFMPEDKHPITLGADAVADSAHKTLPCLTPAALLHLKNAVTTGKARNALNLFCGTSPAYPVLLSLDLCAGLLLQAPPNFGGAAESVASLRQEFAELVLPCSDSLRLVLCPPSAGYSAQNFHAALITLGILPEYFDGQFIVLMASPFNTEEDYNALRSAITAACTCTQKVPRQVLTLPAPTILPRVAYSIRDAYFAQKENIPLQNALGRVMAGLCAPCPPGVPLVLPGEVIDENAIQELQNGGVLFIDVIK